jgi:hypothetical protein
MSMDSQPRGAEAHITNDALLDAYALVAAYISGDTAAQDGALASPGLRPLTAALTAMTASALTRLAEEWSGEATTEHLTVQQIGELAKMILAGGLHGAGAPGPPLPGYLTGDGSAQAPTTAGPGKPSDGEIDRTAVALIAAAHDGDNKRCTELLTGAHPHLPAHVAVRIAWMFSQAIADADDPQQLRAQLGLWLQRLADDDGAS